MDRIWNCCLTGRFPLLRMLEKRMADMTISRLKNDTKRTFLYHSLPQSRRNISLHNLMNQLMTTFEE